MTGSAGLLSGLRGQGAPVYWDIPKRSSFHRTLQYLFDNTWLDSLTRAVFVEFTVYNANVNLFCTVTLTLETSALGGQACLWTYLHVPDDRHPSLWARAPHPQARATGQEVVWAILPKGLGSAFAPKGKVSGLLHPSSWLPAFLSGLSLKSRRQLGCEGSSCSWAFHSPVWGDGGLTMKGWGGGDLVTDNFT